MDFNANGMTPSGVPNNNVSELEEILNLQRQGRRLSDMQLRSLDDCFQRRMTADSNTFLQTQLAHQLPPQQAGMNMPFQSQSLQHSMLGDQGLAGFAANEQFGASQSLHPDSSRRRSSLALFSNYANEFGFNSKPDNMDRRHPMDRRNSLDLLGDAAMAVANQEQNIVKRSSLDLLIAGDHQKRASIDFFMNGDQKRSSMDLLTNGDAAMGRRNSLTQLFAHDFTNTSRRSSMAGGLTQGSFGNPIDPYYMENLFDDQAKFAAAGLGLPNIHPGNQGADMITLQLLQQQKNEEETALSNVEDYIKLQKLQTSLRRQSLSHMYDEMNMMHQMQNTNPLSPRDNELPQATQAQMEHIFQQQQQQQILQEKHLNSKKPSKPEPEPEEEEPPPFTVDQIDSFNKSMETSAQSQQDIQTWDKKMGLKRSHSATMTKTTRSRKDLSKILERHRAILRNCEEESSGTKSDEDEKQ